MKLAASLANIRRASRAAMPSAGEPPRTHSSAEPAPRREHIVRRKYVRISLFSGLVLAVAGALLAQDTPEPGAAQKSATTFVVNGKTVDAQVLNIDGRSYVDIDSLTQIAQITNGSITVEPSRIVLTIPAPASNAPAAASGNAPGEATPPAAVQGLSKGFVTTAIADLAEMREWRGATATMITYGLAVSEAWASSYHDRAQDGLTQATVAAATDDDREALGLLTNEFDRLAKWSGDTLAARQALNGAQTIDPNTLQNDQTLAKINNCGEFLSGMLLSGAFSDNASCH
jgi:hypothetical protein